MKHLFFKLLSPLIIAGLILSSGIPTKHEILNLTRTLLTRLNSKITEPQKRKILDYVSNFSSTNNKCPGYKFVEGTAHVETLNKGGAFLQAGFEAVFKGKIEVAEWCFLNAVTTNPDCPVFLSNTAFTLNYLGDYSNALTFLNYAILLDPLYVSAWVNIGYSQKNLKHFKEAKKAYQIAIALNPEIDDYRTALREVYEQEKGEGRGENKPSQETSNLDQALDILNKGKLTQKNVHPENPGIRPQNSPLEGPERDEKLLLSSMGKSYNSDMRVLGIFIPGLAAAAGQFFREAEWHKEKEDESRGVLKVEHNLGKKAWTALGFLCMGYIKEITGSWERSERIVEDAFERIPHRPEDYNPIRGLSPEWHMPPIKIGFDGISFSIDPDNPTGAVSFSIGEGIILGFSMGKKGWAVKIGVGVKAEAGVAGVGGGYFIKYDSIKGFGGSIEGKATCAGMKIVLPFSHSFSFENN